MNEEKVIYTVPGVGSLIFGSTPPYFCESFSGSAVSAIVKSTTALGVNGQTVTDLTLAPRTIPCKFALLAVDKAAKKYDYVLFRQLQQEVLRILNPINTGTLTRVNRYGTYFITARPSESPVFEKVVGASCRFSVDFIADEPTWLGTRKKEFIFSAPGIVTLYNNAGESSPFELRGVIPAGSSFSLKNTTSGKILTLRNLNLDFDMEFSLDTYTCKVMAQKESGGQLEAANYIFTADSDLDMELQKGENIFSYEVSGSHYEDADKALTIISRDRYVGVT